jgi:S1-C subfamily serine protease
MRIGGFLARSIVIGLAVAFVIVWLRPELLPSRDNAVTSPGILSIPAAVSSSAPAVANIYTTRAIASQEPRDLLRQRMGFGQAPSRLVTSLGSGVIIDGDGYIVTNHHVIADATDIKVQFSDGRVAEPIIIGTDSETDLALLKVTSIDIPAISLGRSDTLRIGEFVLAIGNPYGLSQTVTQGIVSATGRDQLGLTQFENYIQTDAAINIGNSGGALVNLAGELVGINTAVLGAELSSQGIGFAIPVNLVRGVVRQLREYGRVRRGWLGVVPRDLPVERVAELSLPDKSGIELVNVYLDSPAYSIGLRPGDIITHINGQPIQLARQALNLVAAMSPGDAVNIRGFSRQGAFDIQTRLVERPPATT